ncbi:MAG: hypothetical protein EA369_01890 [Bradymonadales bacterium]|nr:MAG: hypothetical protein EA369_01890 [Bradymonadales bacterium]
MRDQKKCSENPVNKNFAQDVGCTDIFLQFKQFHLRLKNKMSPLKTHFVFYEIQPHRHLICQKNHFRCGNQFQASMQ